jgi:biopolymer transport protein ExbD
MKICINLIFNHKKQMMRFPFLVFSLILLFGCSNQHEYKYKGDFPTWEYVNFYNAEEIGDIMTVDTSMVTYRNRIYITIDSLGDLYLNNHLVTVEDLKRDFEFVYTNPKQLKHLPVSPEKSVFFFAMNFLPKNTLNPSMADNKKVLELSEVIIDFKKIVFDLQEDFLKSKYGIHLSAADSIQQAAAEKRFPLNMAVHTIFFEDFNDGLEVKRSPASEESNNLKLKKRNVFRVVVTSNNKIIVRGKEIQLANLRKLTKKFIGNNGIDPELSEKPKRAIISLQNDKSTDYEAYIAVYNELKAAYDELWNELSLEKYNQPFDKLDNSQQREIKAKIPLVIAEAEPTDFGEE